MSNPFVDKRLRDWFLACHHEPECKLPACVMRHGAGPFDEDDFDALLTDCAVRAMGVDEGARASHLVIGREQWNASLLDALLDTHMGRPLCLYSQEMMLAFIMTRRDPSEDIDLCWAFAEGHPALRCVQELGFPWPATTIVPRRQSAAPPPQPRIPAHAPADQEPQFSCSGGGNGGRVPGLLKYFGYGVGKKGKPPHERRAILRGIFECDQLPIVYSVEYRRRWGAARSGMRLRAIASEIAGFCATVRRYARRKTSATCEWEADLEWLKTEFYDGAFRFDWPGM